MSMHPSRADIRYWQGVAGKQPHGGAALITKRGAPRRKYGNQPTTVGTEKYRSKREATRHAQLLLLQRGGQIRDIRREVPFVLAPGVLIQGRMRPPLRYVADFVYDELVGGVWQPVVEDAKGVRTEGYRVKRHLMASVLGIHIRET